MLIHADRCPGPEMHIFAPSVVICLTCYPDIGKWWDEYVHPVIFREKTIGQVEREICMKHGLRWRPPVPTYDPALQDWPILESSQASSSAQALSSSPVTLPGSPPRKKHRTSRTKQRVFRLNEEVPVIDLS